jgi:hypothetical protein
MCRFGDKAPAHAKSVLMSMLTALCAKDHGQRYAQVQFRWIFFNGIFCVAI